MFTLSCLEHMLLSNFLKYVSESESNVLKHALENFDETDNNDLLEVISNFDSKWFPTKPNIKQLIMDIAHKELVQKPSFFARCFLPHLQNIIIQSEL